MISFGVDNDMCSGNAQILNLLTNLVVDDSIRNSLKVFYFDIFHFYRFI